MRPMDSPVVKQMANSFFEAGFTCLRFNFRGTGKSLGFYDNGDGEQKDVQAALDWLKEHHVSSLFLAGYSFGAWVNAHVVAAGARVDDHIMVSPPAAFLSFDSIPRLPSTGLIIAGDADDLAPLDKIQSLADQWGISPTLAVLDRGDHFYSGHLNELRNILLAYLCPD
ncbi:MAG: alpha/beta fold hydrolase [Desulfobacter sp.]|nr:alpha/beta fold hydrolase [Desulfobacter sp.]WDP86964.1 MAG: alpha/beta fold hydrolase [Desulfobacter sp.]